MCSPECVFGEGSCDRLGSQPAQPSRPRACSYPGHWGWRGRERHHSQYWGLSCCRRTMLPLLHISVCLQWCCFPSPSCPALHLGCLPSLPAPSSPSRLPSFFILPVFLSSLLLPLPALAAFPSSGLCWARLVGVRGLWPHTSCLSRPASGSAVKHSYQVVE